jgi:hypothetical protein
MITGFNTNSRHRGVLFHVQTEDRGLATPQVVSHLFYGGNILASEKRDYSDRLGCEDVAAEVRKLMEAQHRAMLEALKSGVHDAVILERLGPDVFKDGSSTDTTLKPPPPAPEPAVEPALAAPDASERPGARSFGEAVVSGKPLDELVLDYLVENARKRKRKAR